MSEVCCDLCAYWLPQFKECGNTHINKCINKERFVKVERNCGTCEREIRAEAIDEFAERLHDLCGYEEDGFQYPYLLHESRIDEIAKQLKAGDNNE